MGPIELELRKKYSDIEHEAQGSAAWVTVSWPAFRHLQQAAWRLGYNADAADGLINGWRDIASEAIEAAEALGL